MHTWRRSSTCANSGCIEVLITDRDVSIRDTLIRHAITVNHDEWQTFIEGVKRGEFD